MGSLSTLIRTFVALTVCFSFSLGNFRNSLFGLSRRSGGSTSNLFFKENDALPTVTVASRGQSIVLECQAGGNSPTIHWSKDGIRIQQGPSRDYLLDQPTFEKRLNVGKPDLVGLAFTKSKLFLDCVTPEMAGVYVCVAKQGEETIEQSTRLVVDEEDYTPNENCLANWPSRRSGPTEPARIFMWTRNRLEFEGNAVQLYCRAEGYPTPAITWYFKRNGQTKEITSSNSQFELLPSGDLLIHDISFRKNMGSFRCEASNDSGIDSVTMFLYPTKPSVRR